MLAITKDAFASSFKRPLTWIAMVAVPALVACFGLLYFTTFLDPFERMKDLPVAIINEDAGAEVDGSQENYGAELVESIMENDGVLWTEEDASLLDDGLESSDYYLAVVIPEDFSARVAAGQTREPEQANITFYKNERKSYMLATLSSRIETELRNTVSESVSKQYTRAFVEGLSDASEGFAEAADGAGTLGEGLDSAESGSKQLEDGMASLASGEAELASGASTLSSGTREIADGAGSLADGASSAANGAVTLSSKTADAKTAASSLAKGAGSCATGAQELATGIDSLASGLAALQSGSSAFAAEVQEKADACAAGASSLDAAKAAYATALQACASNPSEANLTALDAAAQGLAQASSQAGAWQALSSVKAGYAEISAGIDSAAAGAADVQSGADGLASGVSTLQSGAESLASGMQSLSEGAQTLAGGAQTVASGASSLSAGSKSAASGATKLQSGISSLAGGTAQLQDGAASLSSGLGDATSGTAELQESLADGAQEIEGSLTASADEMASYVSDPVGMNDEVYGELPSFGYGFAPLFLTLCMWLGSLLVFFIFDPFPSRGYLNANRFAAVFGRWPVYLLLAAVNAAVAFGGALAAGLPCTDVGALAALFACMAFSFMCIMQFFNLFDIPGKAVAVLFVILQLVCCSGTLPAELGTDLAEAAGPMLPFYYAIDALREIMSGGVLSTAYSDMGVLLAFAAGAVACTLLAYPVALRMKKRRDAKTVEGITGQAWPLGAACPTRCMRRC